MKEYERLVTDLAKTMDIEINGSRPWDIQVRDPRVFRRLLAHGSLGLGESYMDGWWDVDDLPELIKKLIEGKQHLRFNMTNALLTARFLLSNLQNKRRSFTVGEKHYDLGNDLYIATLGPHLQYTANIWSRGGRRRKKKPRKRN